MIPLLNTFFYSKLRHRFDIKANQTKKSFVYSTNFVIAAFQKCHFHYEHYIEMVSKLI